MGLATIDSHSQKEHTEIHKISKFGVNQASFTAFRYSDLKTSKFTEKCMASGRRVGQRRVEHAINSDLGKIDKWYEENEMRRNHNKYRAMVMGKT